MQLKEEGKYELRLMMKLWMRESLRLMMKLWMREEADDEKVKRTGRI